MSVEEENKARINRIIEEAVNQRNLATVDEIVAPNYVYHDRSKEFIGPEGYKEMLSIWHTAFPDLHVTITDMVAEGDKVAVFSSSQGTQRGDLFGTPPTHMQVNVSEVDLVRFENGKQVEGWPLMDRLALWQQLGTSPPNQ